RVVEILRRGCVALRIGELGLRRQRLAVLRPDCVVEREGRRAVAQADDDRDLTALEAVAALARHNDVRREVERLADALSRDGVEKRAMLPGNLVEPVVLGVPCGTPRGV